MIEDSEVIAKVKGNGPGTVTVVSKPSTATKGNVGNAVAKVTYPDGSKDIVPVEVTVREKDTDIYTPEYDKGNGKPGTKVEIPVTPDTNGGSVQDTPASSPTTPVPDAVTPNADQVDTKTTNDNGAKSNDSQNVLPNTGTESNATLASLGLLGMLGGLGLALGKKKED